jgi:hypothetical protein
MNIVLSRLRLGEVIAGVGGTLLLVFMLALPWYGLKSPIDHTAAGLGVATSVNGWHALAHVRWLMLVTIVAALALVYLQVTRRAPALPATFSVIVTLLGLFASVALIYRVLINVPGLDMQARAGAYLGLFSAIAILFGGFASLRQEGIRAADAPGEIETVKLGP